MSDGSERSTQGRPSVDDFGRAISRVSVAQICETVGFEGFKESALDALNDVVIRYLRDLGKAATFYANLSGRTECNVFDVVRGLEDLGISVGFSGAFNSMGCVANSGIVSELIDFVGSNEDVPFAQPIPRFPVYRDRRLIPSFMSMNEDPPGKHIPAWLPALPDPHTYLHTPMWNERVTDPRAEKIEQARQRRKAERALLSLQQRLLINGSVPSSSSVFNDVSELGVVANGSQLVSPGPSNPVKNNGSMVALLDKTQNTVSVMDAFAPAIEAAATQDMVCDVTDDSEKKFLPEKRPAVNFKLKSSKKLLGQSSFLSNSKRREGRAGYYLGREDERDDKKRRAEYILRQSMENPQELTLL